ncbi:MAG: glycosyl transferase family 90 [Verrucomicrobiota bacterium JB023]|nr:glycosyl transferase family 90 [Verrucomicrobiota bacterium JB023]
MKSRRPSLHKVSYYLSHAPAYLLPDCLYRFDADKNFGQLSEAEQELVLDRVDQCNQLNEPFTLSPQARSLRSMPFAKNSAYKMDMAHALRGHGKGKPFDSIFGDITEVPATPSFVKTRPIAGDTTAAVLLKLNTPRHFTFFKDPLSFEEKKDLIVYRSKAHKKDRKELVKRYYQHPRMDIGSASNRSIYGKGFLPQTEQLQSKFIISVEGVDVASNLKWIMASNSLCVMKPPTMESWFLESNLVAGKHYIAVNDDFSNLEEVVQPYLDNPALAQEMLHHAHDYVAPFRNPLIERQVAYRVIERYFKLARNPEEG